MVKITDKSRAVLRTSKGDMTLEFLHDKAPRTVENFVKLAHKGFYEGLTFHRVLEGFMIQGGCPKGDGSGGPGYTIRPEFNDTPHVKGTVSMARSNDPHSAGSQFFVMHGEARYLDGRYTAFAKVVDGLDVLDKIAAVPTNLETRFNEKSVPRDPIYINRVDLEHVELDEDEGAEGGADKGERAKGDKGGDKGDKRAKGGDKGDKGGDAKDADAAKGRQGGGGDDDDDGGKSSGGRGKRGGGKGKGKQGDDQPAGSKGGDEGGDGDGKSGGGGRKKSSRRGGGGKGKTSKSKSGDGED